MLFIQPILTLEAVRKQAALVAFARVLGWGILSDESAGSGQHADLSNQADVRTAPGWLSVRRLVIFLNTCTKSLGTELGAHFESMVRTAPGWLSVRTSQFFFQTNPLARDSTRICRTKQTSVPLLAGCRCGVW